jgi:hypothetical protein
MHVFNSGYIEIMMYLYPDTNAEKLSSQNNQDLIIKRRLMHPMYLLMGPVGTHTA